MATDVPDPASLETAEEVADTLSRLETLETDLDASLGALIQDTLPLENLQTTITALRQPMDAAEGQAKTMASDIAASAEMAEHIAAKVRQLDLEQSRIRESMDMLTSVQDLKNSIVSLSYAFDNKDWESATLHVQRAMALDDDIVASAYAEAVVPTADLPLPPPQTLDQFRSDMLKIFLSEFNRASAERDEAELSRYFKLFPMIGHASEGLNAYADFVTTLISTRKKQTQMHGTSIFFPSLLTPLFEQISVIISQHQPVVEKYYGNGEMLRVVEKIQTECDKQACFVVRQWQEERRPLRLVSIISPEESSGRNTPQSSSKSSIQGGPYQNSFTSERDLSDQDDSTTSKEVDSLLSELTQISARWHLYKRFLYLHLKNDHETSHDHITTDPLPDHQHPNGILHASRPTTTVKSNETIDDEDLQVIETSAFQQLLDEQLRVVFAPLDAWSIRKSIDKAQMLDEPDLTVTPWLSSSLDDTFFIIKKSLHRLITLAHSETLTKMLGTITSILEKRFALVLTRRIETAYNPSSKPHLRKEEREREAQVTSIVYLNDLDKATEYIIQLVDEVLDSESLQTSFFRERHLKQVTESIHGLKNLSPKIKSILSNGIEQVFNQLIRPRLRTLLNESYRDVIYVLDEPGYNEAEYQDIVRKRFVRLWDDLVGHYHEAMTESNYRSLFNLIITVIVRPWENIIKNLKFSELGALRFDRDLRAIIAHLSSQTPFGVGVLMDRFARLQQIATVLSLDSTDDIDDLLSSPGWKLSKNEVLSFMECRT